VSPKAFLPICQEEIKKRDWWQREVLVGRKGQCGWRRGGSEEQVPIEELVRSISSEAGNRGAADPEGSLL
jgi:hypothetical protein